MFEKRTLVVTTTGEPYQPSRIYYQVFNRKTVISALNKLRCIFYDRQTDLWEWGYEFESQKLRFEKSYKSIPKEKRPILLGRFQFKDENSLILDVRSLARVTKALQFFDKRINRRAATPTHCAIVNKLFAMEKLPNRELYTSHDIFFEDEDAKQRAEQEERELKQVLADLQEVEDQEARMEAMNKYLEEIAQKPLPEIESLPIHVDEGEGFMQVEMALSFRMRVAYEHWGGNKNFKLADAIQSLVDSLPDLEITEEELASEEEE
jgi:hypothetical protein